MKTNRILSLLLCLIMVLSMAACGGNTPAETTEAPVNEDPTDAPEVTDAPADTTETPVETTEAPVETTEAPIETTEALVETTPIEFADLTPAEQEALKAVMPVTLPDLSSYEIVSRAMSFDRGTDDYFIDGNSKGSAEFVNELNGAIYGQAIKMAAINDAGTNRTEISVTPYSDMDISEAKGVLFYVDFSNVLPTGEADKMCTSVTINTNDYRARGAENGTGTGVAYYYMYGTTWVETTNINACRMLIPDNFAGWIYIPASSFYDKNASAALGETFGDVFVMNMRCYTDGYTYSADNYIIFDEIVFVK